MSSVRATAEAPLPTRYGPFRVIVFREEANRAEHVALVRCARDGELSSLGDALLVRVHSECIPGEVFGSLQCDCAQDLDTALAMIEREGRGVVIYLRQGERGIGLADRVRAYDDGAPRTEVSHGHPALGLPSFQRRYQAAAGMLRALGVERIRLVTRSAEKVRALREVGVEVVAVVPAIARENSLDAYDATPFSTLPGATAAR